MASSNCSCNSSIEIKRLDKVTARAARGKRLARRNVPLFNTLEDGGIALILQRNGEWRIEAMQGREAASQRKAPKPENLKLTTP